jgi:hypothetical protein
MNTKELIAAVKKAQGAGTDYRVAQLLDTQPTTVTNWAKGRNVISDEYAIRAARLANLDPAYVLVSIAAERAAGEAKGILERLAAALVCMLVGLFVFLAPYFAEAGFPAWNQAHPPTLHIMLNTGDVGGWVAEHIDGRHRFLPSDRPAGSSRGSAQPSMSWGRT